MSATGLAVFDKTLQETNAWLKVLMHELETDDRERAYGALKATLHALRDRIGPETHLISAHSCRCSSAALTTKAGIWPARRPRRDTFRTSSSMCAGRCRKD